MVSANSRTQREEVKTYKYPRKAPELAWDLGVHAIAVKSERSGWPFERQGGNATRLWKKKFEHQKSTMGPKSTVGMSPKPTPQSRHIVRLQVFFTCSLAILAFVHRHPLPHLKCESEKIFSFTPMHGLSRYVNYLAESKPTISDSPRFSCIYAQYPRVRPPPHVRFQYPPVRPQGPRCPRYLRVRVQHPCAHARQFPLTHAGQMLASLGLDTYMGQHEHASRCMEQ